MKTLHLKKISLIIAAFFALILTSSSVSAQKFAYVDSQYILDNIPDYQAAQNKIDQLSIQWQKEIEEKFSDIDKLYKNFQAEVVLLPEDMKKKKEDEIIKKEKEVKDLQKQKFGKEGDLFKKKQELIKPIQDKVYNAIKEISTQNNYSFVFDSNSNLTMLYVDPKYDISDDVLTKMGYKPGTYKKTTDKK